ncbi:MAG: YgiT-type zinc finger protein [Iamia sp.]
MRRAKLMERNGRVAVVTGVPMEECPSCGERWMTLDVAEALDGLTRRLLACGGETDAAPWDDLAPAATVARDEGIGRDVVHPRCDDGDMTRPEDRT